MDSESKHFRHFRRKFFREQEFCRLCDKEMSRVLLEKSDSKRLVVACSDPNCQERYTLARRFPRR